MADSTLRASVFEKQGLRATIASLVAEVQHIYRADAIPWVVGYSGGKDSTATLELVWLALLGLPEEERHKPVHVISTDTLVENPVVAAWVSKSLQAIRAAAARDRLPVEAHRLTPALGDTFWVNLIGKGYPAPRPKFRWCTERMKIKPSNAFIRDVVRENGEAIVVLGTRKAESSHRSSNMAKYEAKRIRDRLSPNGKLPNSLIFSPIEDWSNDDVWLFLMQVPNPWGYNNKDLLTMYSGASEDGECPLVIDDTTPSCGDSRFGCWVCTLVERDRSMAAMIQNDEEKEWMLPLLELRNELDLGDDRHLRDFRRMNGTVQLFRDRAIHGPYTQDAREHWLRRLLEAQENIRKEGPAYVRDLELITVDELQEIRRIWVVDKHELEDRLPRVFEDVTGRSYPAPALEDTRIFGHEEVEILRRLAAERREAHLFPLVRELLAVEWRHRTKARRSGLFDALESAIGKYFYEDEEDAVLRKRREKCAREAAEAGTYRPSPVGPPAAERGAE